MSLVPGSVSVSNTGVRTGTGMAVAIYDAHEAAMSALVGAPWATTKLLNNAAVLKAFAALATAYSSAIIGYLTANTDVLVSVSTGGLQRDNTGGNPATLAPSSTVVLEGVLE